LPLRSPSLPERASGLARGAWLALCLALARGTLLAALELSHHDDGGLARRRLAGAALWITSVALGLGLFGALKDLALSSWSHGRRRLAARGVLVLFLSAACTAYLLGRFDPDPSRRVGLETGRGVLVLAAAGLSALVLCAWLLLARRPLGGLALRARSGLPPLLGLLAAAGLLRWTQRDLGAQMEVRTVVRELCREPWEVLAERADAPVRLGFPAPSLDYERNGAARPALLLPPPARARLDLGSQESGHWLTASVGLDHSVVADLGASYADRRVRFLVRLDGEPAWSLELPLVGEQEWHPLNGRQGLWCPPGAVLELETSLLDAQGRAGEAPDALLLGFAGLELERRSPVARARSSPEAPSVVLIVIDTLRADRTSAYGYARDTTPHLRALAERGVLYETAQSTSSWTWPATASILTGLAPQEHGVEDAEHSYLPADLDTLAEALQRQGFTTACWSGSPLIVPDKNFDQGFETFDSGREPVMRRSEVVLPPALEWLDAIGDRRFFLYLHLMDPHAPQIPLAEGRRDFAAEVPRDFDPWRIVQLSWQLRDEGFDAAGRPRTEELVTDEERRSMSALYDACVWSADHWIGQVLERLERLGLEERTVVAVTSDHGEELLDHALLTHGHSLYQELIHVPLVLAGPGVPRGLRLARPVSTAALGPTLARLGGAELAGSSAPLRFEAGDGPEAVLFSTRQGWWNGSANQSLQGMRRGALVLQHAPGGRPWGAAEDAGDTRLFDLGTDPFEREDLARGDPARIEGLLEELRRRLSELGQRAAGSGFEVDDATRARLGGLGYSGDVPR